MRLIALSLAAILYTAPAQAADSVAMVLAPNGAWGIGISSNIGQALTRAMADCKAKPDAPKLGCGYVQRITTSEWILGLACGKYQNVGTGNTFAEAEFDARTRLREIEWEEGKRLPECVLLQAHRQNEE